jgi:hypothetical protein
MVVAADRLYRGAIFSATRLVYWRVRTLEASRSGRRVGRRVGARD